MEMIKITGGARIGSANATWPFSTLKVNKDKLELNTFLVGNLVFQPKDIISIEPYSGFTFGGNGIKINHNISNYDSKVIFWTFQDSVTVINHIRQLGFFDNTNSTSYISGTINTQEKQIVDSPIKKNISIGFGISWNILILYDFVIYITTDSEAVFKPYGATIATAGLFLFSTLTLISKHFRKLVVNEGQTIESIKKSFYFRAFISGFVFIVLLISRII